MSSRTGSAPMEPDDLLRELLEAVAQRDARRLSDLCTRHQQLIRERFASWRRVPQSIRNDRARVDHYVHTLVTVAEAFAAAGRPQLLQLVTGDKQTNPLTRWYTELDQAQALVETGRYNDAITLLLGCLEEHGQSRGTGADQLLPRTHGLLGIAYFQTGDVVEARQHTHQALTVCEELGDTDGVATYSENLRLMS